MPAKERGEGSVLTIQKQCDGGKVRIKTVYADTSLVLAGFYTSQWAINAPNRDNGT
jgi:hypothetical protein